MAALSHQTMINSRDAYYLSSIGNDVTHSTIQTQEIDANLARFSTVFVSETLNASTVKAQFLEASGAILSSLRLNQGTFSTLNLLSDLSGGVGRVQFTADASGVVVSGDPIIFNNVVFLTSSINVVQVSTIVDATIQAQSGFFSTLSSGVVTAGSITASSIRANAGFLSTLQVSSITTTDISGFAPSDWSLYPTLNSSITFQPGNVLSNIGNKLFFAGNEITDLSGGGANWSAFPATQDVSMNNFSLRALSTLQYQDGARLYSQTGNNLFYNGQPISYGPSGNASNWSQFPAKTNITAGQSTLTVGNIQNNGSNITNGNTFTNSLGVGGLSLVPIASITSGGDLSCRNIEVGDSTTSVADVNIYGANAVPGDNALYVQGGVQFDGGTIHGFSAGLLPVAGINTGRVDVLQAGINILHPVAVVVTSAAAVSLATGGAMSLAAGAYIETNTSTIQCINTSQGNKNTTLQTGFITVDPDIAATSSIKLFNVLGGGVEIDGGGQGSLIGFSTVQSQFISSLSTNANTSRVNQEFASSIFTNFILCTSSVFNNIAVNNIKIADDITGVTNAPNPNQSRLLNFSTVNSFNISTTDFWCSSINGQAIGGGGGSASSISSFVTLTTSSLNVSSINQIGGGAIKVDGFLQFATPNTIDNVVNVNLGYAIPTLNLTAQRIVLDALSNTDAGSVSTVRLQSSELKTNTFLATDISSQLITTSSLTVSSINQIGGGAIKVAGFLQFATPESIDNVVNINIGYAIPTLTINAQRINLDAQSNTNVGSLSTLRLNANSFIVSTIEGRPGGLDISGDVFINGNATIPLGKGLIFDDGSPVNNSQFEFRDIAANSMVALTNNPGLASNNMTRLGVGELWLTGGADQYQAVRMYSQFPYGNFELDAIDANGTTLFAYMQGYQNPFGTNPGFLQAYSNVSSISGYDESSAPNQMLNVINGLTTSNLIVSSINGAAPGGGGGTTSQFSTLFVSSLNFSSATSYTSNTAMNYPIFVEHDAAGATSNSGAAIAVSGHNFSGGAVVQQIEMGWRVSGENYIASVWPGQNLEDLQIESSQLLITNGVQSSFMNFAGYALQTGNDILVGTTLVAPQSISTLALNVSSINGNDAQPAYLNALTTSTLLLYAGSTTLMSLDSRTAFSNINISGYDAVVGLNGTYKIGTSFQFISPGSADEVEFFVLKNNSPISYGGGVCQVQNNQNIIQYCEIVETLVNGDSIQVGCFTNGANVYASTTTGTAIVSPAMILTMYKVD